MPTNSNNIQNTLDNFNNTPVDQKKVDSLFQQLGQYLKSTNTSEGSGKAAVDWIFANKSKLEAISYNAVNAWEVASCYIAALAQKQPSTQLLQQILSNWNNFNRTPSTQSLEFAKKAFGQIDIPNNYNQRQMLLHSVIQGVENCVKPADSTDVLNNNTIALLKEIMQKGKAHKSMLDLLQGDLADKGFQERIANAAFTMAQKHNGGELLKLLLTRQEAFEPPSLNTGESKKLVASLIKGVTYSTWAASLTPFLPLSDQAKYNKLFGNMVLLLGDADLAKNETFQNWVKSNKQGIVDYVEQSNNPQFKEEPYPNIIAGLKNSIPKTSWSDMAQNPIAKLQEVVEKAQSQAQGFATDTQKQAQEFVNNAQSQAQGFSFGFGQ